MTDAVTMDGDFMKYLWNRGFRWGDGYRSRPGDPAGMCSQTYKRIFPSEWITEFCRDLNQKNSHVEPDALSDQSRAATPQLLFMRKNAAQKSQS